MNRRIFFLLLCCSLLGTGCSGDDEKKKSSVDSFTEENAQKAVEYIQEPLDQARAVQQLANKHSGEIKKAAEAEK